MKIEKNKVVSLTYILNAEDENGNNFFVESIEKDEPVVFLFGSSGFPEKFEEELTGLEGGKDFDFKLTSDEAYGTKDEEAIVHLPKTIFLDNGNFDAERFKVGTIVPMTDENGQTMPARILEIHEDNLLLDFNHPLAGYNLFFKGTIIDVRSASREELEHGHVHGPGGHHHH